MDERACTDHPHCPFCGGIQVEEPDRVVCVNCGTEAPVENQIPAEMPS